MDCLALPYRPLLVPLIVVGAVVANAGQTSAPVADKGAKPAGLRVLRSGHGSGTENSGPLCAAAGIAEPPKQTPKPEPTAKPGPAERNVPASGG